MKFIKKESCTHQIQILIFYKNLKNPDGFFYLYFIFFLTLLTTFIFVFAFIFYASQSKDTFRTSCVLKAFEIERNLIQSEKKLFLLNTPSTLLRLQILSLYAQLAVAVPPADIAILAEINLIKNKQQQLSNLQKKIIYTANFLAANQYTEMISKINSTHQTQKQKWSAYLNIFTFVTPKNLPKMSVQEDSIGGLAPNYELKSDFYREQRVELHWQNWFGVSEDTQKIFNPKNFLNTPSIIKYGFTCKVEPERINSKWGIKIKMDKF